MRPQRRQFGSKAPSRKSARASLRSLLRDCRLEKLASFTPDSEEWRSIVRSNSTPDAQADAMLAEIQAERLETRRASSCPHCRSPLICADNGCQNVARFPTGEAA